MLVTSIGKMLSQFELSSFWNNDEMLMYLLYFEAHDLGKKSDKCHTPTLSLSLLLLMAIIVMHINCNDELPCKSMQGKGAMHIVRVLDQPETNYNGE